MVPRHLQFVFIDIKELMFLLFCHVEVSLFYIFELLVGKTNKNNRASTTLDGKQLEVYKVNNSIILFLFFHLSRDPLFSYAAFDSLFCTF